MLKLKKSDLHYLLAMYFLLLTFGFYFDALLYICVYSSFCCLFLRFGVCCRFCLSCFLLFVFKSLCFASAFCDCLRFCFEGYFLVFCLGFCFLCFLFYVAILLSVVSGFLRLTIGQVGDIMFKETFAARIGRFK